MLSVSLTSLSDPLRRLLDVAVTSIARDPAAQPGTRPDRPFEAVQLDGRRQARAEQLSATARRELRHRLSERDLSLSSLTFPLRASLAEAERLDERIDALREAMTLTYELGGRHTVVPGGRLPAEDSPEAARLAEVLAVLARHGERCGTLPTLRLGADAAAWAAWLDACDLPTPVQFDPASCVIGGQPVADAFAAVSERIVQVRVRDAVAESRGAGREVRVGRGEVDFDMLAALSTQLSRPPAIIVDPGEATAADLRAAVAFARAVFAPR